MKMMKPIVCLVVLMFCSINAIVEVKNLAGPPSEFGYYTLPTPQSAADIQNSASFSVALSATDDASILAQTLDLLVDSDKEFQFVFYSPNNQSLTLSLKSPAGNSVLLQGITTYYPIGDNQVVGTQYIFKDPIKGKYVLTITSTPLSAALYAKLAAPAPDAYVVLWNEDALATHTALNTYSLLLNNQVGLVTRVFTETFSIKDMKQGKVPKALIGSVTTAEMTVTLPDGDSILEPMQDDGLHDDGAANDGVYGGLITATVPGQYIFTATIVGINEDGDSYVRTTQQLVTVVDPDLSLTGSATGSFDSTNTVLNISIVADAPVGNKYKAYAEVWGTDAKGEEVAVCWISGMSFATINGGVTSVNLQLDLNWVSKAGAVEPLVLKNVVIQDTATFVPIAQFDIVPVKTEKPIASVMSMKTFMGKDGVITKEMREGKRPSRLSSSNFNTSASGTLLLVHGYCTDKNPFSVYPEDWTNAQFYLNPSQNFGHDQFAMDVIDWAESFGPAAYVGHSQGGVVGLHLKNYYWSNLDQVDGGRLVQSVGSPYQGSGGAGTAADLAKLFGVLCGKNQDLTKDGSALWLGGVTAENRAEVYYYTSTYVQGKFFGDYCNLATNLVLSWPNDGVAEYEFSQLPGGQNQGNTEAWCHSVNMKYPPQCQNRERNAIMNQLAARSIQ